MNQITIKWVRTLWISVLLLSAFSYEAMATHISGGDLTYRSLGSYQYEITLVLYRDCAGIPVQNPEPITCTNASGSSFTAQVSLIPNTGNEITFPCFSTQTTCSGGSVPGFQRYEYKGTVNLPPSSNWNIKWEDCCRNCAITTIAPGCSSSYLIEANFNNQLFPNDNSPAFSNYPVAFVCLGQNFTYNNGLVDSEGDSLVYTFIAPRLSGGASVAFEPGYSAANFVTSSTSITLGSNTGDINLTPSQLEVAITAIRIDSYKNGVKVGDVMRDIQFQVQVCNPNIIPTASGINGTDDFDTIVYANSPVCFDIFTDDANPGQNLTLTSNNMIPGATFTVTSDPHPTGTFCWTPTVADARPQPYSFTVMVKDDNCAYNSFQVYSYRIFVPEIPVCNIHVGPDFNSTNVCGTSTVTLLAGNGATTYGDSVVTYLWSTGETTPSITVTLDSTASYSVSMNNSFFPCSDSYTVHVNYPNTSEDSASACNSLQWNGTTYTQSGTYVYHTLNESGCDSAATLHLTIYTPSSDPASVTSSKDSVVIGSSVTLTVNGGSLGSNSNWVWYSGSCGGTPIGQGASISVSPAVPTTYYVRAEGECNTTSCVSKSIGVIYCDPTSVVSNKPNNATCKGTPITLSVTGPINGGAVWKWYKGTCGGTSSSGCTTSIGYVGTGASISVSPTSTTTYFVRAEGGPCGITSCLSITVTVNTIPATPGMITGPVNGLCGNNAASYSIAPVAGATSYAWTVPTGATIISGQGTTSILVSYSTSLGSNSSCGSSSVCVKAINSCGSSSSRCVSVSLRPSLTGTITGATRATLNQVLVYSVAAIPTATSYQWFVPSGWVILSGQGTSSATVKVGSSSGSVRVTPINACGAGSTLSKSVSVSCSRTISSDNGKASILYPNPVTTSAFIEYDLAQPGTVLIDVVSLTGQRMVDLSFDNDIEGTYTVELPLTEYHLSPGIYFVRITKEGRQEEHRMIIQ